MRHFMTWGLAAVLVAGGLALGTAGVATAGVTGPAFYVHGELYRTVGTPADLSGTGAPAHSFDVIYAIDGQPNVAEKAPGDPGFNGGRWHVHALSIADYAATVAAYDANGSGDLDSAEEVEAAIAGGGAVDIGIVTSFECPVIPVPRGKAH
jgi:hypothetical protein